jgi:hypothetical protein
MQGNLKKLDFSSFAVQLKELVSAQLGEEFELYLHTAAKNNGGLREGIVVRKKEERVTHSIYLELYYKKYIKNVELENIAVEFVEAYSQAALNNLPEAEVLEDFNKISENIFFRLVNYQKNEDVLRDVPFLTFLDLAITFHCLVQNKKDYISSLRITNRHLEGWGINIKILTEVAKDNTPRIFPASIRTMEEILGGFSLAAADNINRMYVISNGTGINGASCLLYKDVINVLAEELNGNLFILPSSIHEIIVIKDDGFVGKDELVDMVKDVNLTQVAEEDFLSDSVYYYSADEQRIMKA